MKFSLHWLGRYVDLSGVLIEQLAGRFTSSVAELEGYRAYGAGLEDVVVAQVNTVQPLPDSDRLMLCTVSDGSSAPRRVVCGASNIRPGMKTALARPGARLGDVVVEKATIRGVQSDGVLCSPAELTLTDDHSGICVLSGDLEPGTPMAQVIPLVDTIFEVDNKSITHRPDLWGHAGVAREVAALLRRPFRIPPIDLALGTSTPVTVDVQSPTLCPRYVAIRVEGVRTVPSPLWMQTLLSRCGLRPINLLVDVTNYVMLDLGNPLHAFDWREIRGRRIVVRTGLEGGEKVVGLDGKGYEVGSGDLLICDAERPVAIAGVSGLQNSEVRSDTESVLIEAATFNPASIRKTAMRLGLRTEASARFEKALDPAMPPLAARRCARLLVDLLPGARVVSALADFDAGPPPPVEIEVSVGYINERLGTAIPAEAITDELRRLEFEVRESAGDRLHVRVPSFRATKDIAIPEDIVEEVGRVYGYNNIPPAQPQIQLPAPYRDPALVFHRKVRTLLSLGLRYTEARTYSFDHEPFLTSLGPSPWSRVPLCNPVNVENVHLRSHLVPGLLRLLHRSLPYARELQLYEVGRIFRPADSLPEQPFHLALVSWRHPKGGEPTGASRSDGDSQRQWNAFSVLKGQLEALFSRLCLEIRSRRPDDKLPPWFHPGRSAEFVSVGGPTVGASGVLHPRLAEDLGCGPHVALAEFNLDVLQQLAPTPEVFRPIYRHPGVPIDISIVVDEAVTHEELDRLLRAAHPDWIASVDFVTEYRGAPIPPGKRSMTYRLLYQASDRSLSMEEVNRSVQELVWRLDREVGGVIRDW